VPTIVQQVVVGDALHQRCRLSEPTMVSLPLVAKGVADITANTDSVLTLPWRVSMREGPSSGGEAVYLASSRRRQGA
jgi:hypothetical protein